MGKLKNIIEGWKEDLFGNPNPAKKALFDSRLHTCKSNICGKMMVNICTACGCPISKKTKVLQEHCPENEWLPIIYETDGIEFIKLSEVPEDTRMVFREITPMYQFHPEDDAVRIDDWHTFLEVIR